MSKTLIAAIATIITATALSGCVEEIPEVVVNDYKAWGENGYFTLGFAYDGVGVVPFSGPLLIDVMQVNNTGVVHTVGRLGGMYAGDMPCLVDDDACMDHGVERMVMFEVLFNEFKASAPFHDGGIVANLREHGDSGVGNPSIPTVDLEMAGWGTAIVKLDGMTYNAPTTGNSTWNAHFMVIKNGVRSDADHKILKKDGATPYDPTTPGDGSSKAGDLEIHLVLTAPAGPKFDKTKLTSTRQTTQIQSLDFSKSFNVMNKAIGGNLTFELVYSPLTPASSGVTLSIMSPSGKEVFKKAQTAQGTLSPTVPADEFGTYIVTVTGGNFGDSFTTASATYAEKPVTLNLFWEDVYTGAEAIKKIEGAKSGGDDPHAGH